MLELRTLLEHMQHRRESFYKDLTERMKVSSRSEQPLKTKHGQLESVKISKEKTGWRRNGEGDLILWTPEELLERKVNKDLAIGERDKIMIQIRLEFPDIK